MNLLKPVSTIMTTDLITVNPSDSMMRVKEIFDKHKIHHIPVVDYKKIVGIISQTDFLLFHRGYSNKEMDRFTNEARLRAYKVEEIMTKGLAKVSSTDQIRTVLEVFRLNRFHALPVVNGEELVGLVTTFDIIDALAGEKIKLEDYKNS